MRTAENQAFSFNCFLEAAFVDFALAVGADLDFGFNVGIQDVVELVQDFDGELLSFGGEVVLLFISSFGGFVGDELVLLEQLKEGIDVRSTHVLTKVLLELL